VSTETTNYLREASDDAGETVRNFTDEILEMLLDKGEASDDLLNDYPNGDAWHHESHVDKWYSLHDAAAVLDQLDEFEETDSGLWEGQSFKEAIGTCAAFTYGNAVISDWHDLIETINEKAESIVDEYDGQIADLETEIDDLETIADAADTDAGQEQRDEIERKRGDLESLQAEKKATLEKLIEEIADDA